MPSASKFLWACCIAITCLGGMQSVAFASLPLDNIPPSQVFSPALFSPYNFTEVETIDTIDVVEPPAVILGWSSFWGNEHLLKPTSMDIQLRVVSESPTWLLIIILLCLAGLAFVRLNYPYQTKLFLLSTTSQRLYNQLEREGGYFKETPAWILYGIFVLSISALILKSVKHFQISHPLDFLTDYYVFIVIVVLVIVFFIAKGLLTKYLAWVFQTYDANTSYNTNIFLFNNIIGIVLIPLIAIYHYNPTELALIASWAVFLLFNILKLSRGIWLGSTRNKLRLYYLILYLCTIEILPLLIIARLTGIDVFAF